MNSNRLWWVRKFGVVLACCVHAVPFGSAFGQQPRLDIVRIHTQFIEARTAAVAYHAQDPTTEQDFLNNEKSVTIRALQELQKRDPTASAQQIAERETEATLRERGLVITLVETNGCEASLIQGLLALYKIQSRRDLFTTKPSPATAVPPGAG